MRHRRAVMTILIALLALPAAALAATTVTGARYEAPDGTIFRVTASKKLPGGAPRFDLKSTAGATTTVVTSADIKPANGKPLRVGSARACDAPAVSVAYGTVAAAAKRVTATLVDGTKLRLSRTTPPAAWRYDG